ncbi:MAG: tRNA (N(6)-L-threonylcarbamoyladenosine(37)-C(2))-methylthiotransferase MtaB [Christensenella sp.]|nr:tRNA (N(6)-L-threonylcarbamoyladenosine(37)-C(2))-methylthiotransferase MtaB [Christensenella sp.]
MKVALTTLGCKVNHYETEAMRELFVQDGWEIAEFSDLADVYVINTCTVTQTSDTKSRQMIARAHRMNPSALVVAVGCYAQTAPEAVASLEGVGLVIGTSGRKEIVSRVNDALASRADESYISPLYEMREFEPLSAVRDSRTRATLKIQDGCVNFCSYCIIPYARGPLRSRPLDEISTEVEMLSREGYKEIVLTGIHLASYGRDLADENVTLLDVIARASEPDGIRRIRLGSLEPLFVTEAVTKSLSKNPKICRQFHLSLQSGSNTVLLRMNRKYTAEEYLYAVSLLRKYMPDCAVTTDVIAGFAGEMQEEHQETLDFCERAAFARMHVFPFSLRKGTKAESLPNHLPKAVKEARARELIALGKRLTHAYLSSQIGSVVEVLAESDGAGYSGNYIRVKTDAPEGEIVRIRIDGFEDETAFGTQLDSSDEPATTIAFHLAERLK